MSDRIRSSSNDDDLHNNHSNGKRFSFSSSSIASTITATTTATTLAEEDEQQRRRQHQQYYSTSAFRSNILDNSIVYSATNNSNNSNSNNNNNNTTSNSNSNSNNSNTPNASNRFLFPHRSPASALIQAAARSILDDATPSTTADNSEAAGSVQTNSSLGSSYISTWRSPAFQRNINSGNTNNGNEQAYISASCNSTPPNHFQGQLYDSPYSLASSSYEDTEVVIDVSSTAFEQHRQRTPTPSTHSYHTVSANSASSRLDSLQVKTMPALPDEQDRKRFLGCLAAILASSYDFDEPDEEISSSNAAASNLAYQQQAYAYLDYAEQSSYSEDDDEDDAQKKKVEDALRNQIAGHQTEQQQPQNRGPPSLQQAFSANSFEYGEVDTVADIDDDDDADASNHSALSTLVSDDASKKLSSTKQKHRSIYDGWSSGGNSKESKEQLSRQRHRRRRYHVLSKLLIQSSELLLLDNSVGRAFVPMLARVLVPEPKQKRQQSSKPPLWSKSKSTPNCTQQQQTSSAESDDSQHSGLGSAYETMSDLRDLPSEFGEDEVLRPFLESLTAGAGIRCLSLFLLQHLLTSEVGYDARIRNVIKKLGVLVLAHDMQGDPMESCMNDAGDGQVDYDTLLVRASRKFEALEHSVARRIIRLSESPQQAAKNRAKSSNSNDVDPSKAKKNGGITRKQLIRGAKIGTAGVVAGTLFAVTGGLAAGAIFTGVSAFTGTTAAVITLTSPVVITTIFGVGGGGLTAYKMQRRTQGVTEFEFRKETYQSDDEDEEQQQNSSKDSKKGNLEAELFSVICIAGWLTDNYDYQRPWGVHPTNPKLTNRLELLERFYAIHSPEHVPKVAKILASWRGEEDKLWNVLHQKYGRDPDHLFPLEDGIKKRWSLTLEQEEILDGLFVELGYNSAAPKKEGETEKEANPLDRLRTGWKRRKQRFQDDESKKGAGGDGGDSDNTNKRGSSSNTHGALTGQELADFDRAMSLRETASNESVGWESVSAADIDNPELAEQNGKQKLPKHLPTVWDFKATYGGELYTVRWESILLKRICECIMDLAIDVVSGATKQLLKATVLQTLLAAVAWPAALVNVANMIDGDWTLAVERADAAGKDLARTLLFSKAGRRPVTLVGFSFGARIIYSCLKHLARFQEDWEEHQDLKTKKSEGTLSELDQKRCDTMDKKFEGMREPASIIEDVVLMGLPNHLSLISWRACRQVVSGRLVNCYSTKDMILSLMFQMKRVSAGNFEAATGGVLKPVCGTCAVQVPGMENFDVSDLVSSHQDYCVMTGKILERIRLGHPLRSSSLAAAGIVAVPSMQPQQESDNQNSNNGNSNSQHGGMSNQLEY